MIESIVLKKAGLVGVHFTLIPPPMNRLFGTAKKKEEPAAPAPSLGEVGNVMEARTESLEDKIKQLDQELLGYGKKLKALKPGPAQRNIRQKAEQTLRRKRMLEQQRDQLYNQKWNVDQAAFAIESVRENAQVVQGMKQANAALKAAHQEVNIDEIEDMQDDLNDMLEEAQEISEIMGRTYGLPADVDEEALCVCFLRFIDPFVFLVCGLDSLFFSLDFLVISIFYCLPFACMTTWAPCSPSLT